MRFPKPEIFVEISPTNLQSLVWSHRKYILFDKRDRSFPKGGGGGGVLPKKLGGGVRSASQHLPYRGIHADVIVYIFAHLHTALLTEINMLDMN